MQKYRIKIGGKLDGSGAESADLAGKAGCFTVSRNDAHVAFSTKQGRGWVGTRFLGGMDRADH